MGIKTYPYDAAEFLTSAEVISGYLTDALESDDPRMVAHALGAVVRARGGMDRLASETSLSKDVVARALSETGTPDFDAVLKVMHALGVRLTASLVA